ncbi:hypothetical protein SCAR479_12807 [Seiridium cardinale]|uniref:Transcription factor domain-containing protein n=1 Tax=Seiridium cardinale TaxID=138064 RepID=A0ABR2X9R9_9PEZI
MSKRSWEESRGGDAAPIDSGSFRNRPVPVTHAPDAEQLASQHIPMISRKVTACAACRKLKSCVLNKSLQTLISERTESSESMVQDLEMMHSSLQSVLGLLNQPPIAPLQSSKQRLQTPSSAEPEEVLPSCDASPGVTPEDDNDLPKVPIHSLYHLTKLSALRSPDTNETDTAPTQNSNVIDDFISRGTLSLEDAERLFRLFVDHLDHFMYGIGASHATLATLRRSSRILTVSILTVAALHDHQSNSLYGICSKEFRHLLAAGMFNRRINRDYLRAMCIASYWLSEINWTVSGYAIRRATEFNMTNHYNRVIREGNEESADFIRLWYILYICDQHLSTLYGRQSIIREDYTIQNWATFIQSRVTTDEDKRLASQVALLNIIQSIRDLFGPDIGEPVPQVYSIQILSFGRQLDQWLGQWSTTLPEFHDRIGRFPRKGVMLHYHFAKLHLYSHVFRGLQNATIPSYFQECAASATTAAVAIVSTLINDPEIQPALVGMPSYMHSMTAFAAMFLAKATMTYGHQLIDRSIVIDLISRLIALYHSTVAGKFHLVNMMANGLEKLTTALRNRDQNRNAVGQSADDTDSFNIDKQSISHFDDSRNFGGENIGRPQCTLAMDQLFLERQT